MRLDPDMRPVLVSVPLAKLGPLGLKVRGAVGATVGVRRSPQDVA